MTQDKHPFQRQGNPKKTVRTPFQRELVAAMEGYGVGARKISGRQLSQLLGRSSNMVSQLFNDGLVPSGETVLQIAEVLELDREATDRLVLAAMETKAGQRSRDAFWIGQSTRMVAGAHHEAAMLRRFLAERGLGRAFERWLARKKRDQGTRKRPKGRGA